METPDFIPDSDRLSSFQRRHRAGLVTLVFTDMVGSTLLKQELGDEAALLLISQHHDLVRRVLAEVEGGEEINTAGDSFFIAFGKPSSAVVFALQLQAQLRLLTAAAGRQVSNRIGIHVGEVLVEAGSAESATKNVWGIHVDTCARVMSLACGDQILVTRFPFDSARQILRGRDLARVGALSWLNHGLYSVKGVDEPIEVCEVGEEGMAALSAPLDNEKARRCMEPGSEPIPGWRPALGQNIPGTSWVMEKRLGEGGFGEVWLARHSSLKKQQVFKFCFQANRARSLKRELTLFRLLRERVGDHSHIVAVNDVYFDEPPYYLGMEYVNGANLDAWCEARGGAATIPLSSRLEVIAQIADALQAAHDAGIIHRDVKPSNILVTDDAAGSVFARLTDFGIGQVTSEEVLAGITRLGFTETIQSTTTGQSGTQMYMAPELFAGRPATIRSDVYSLGVVLFQLIVGDFQQPVTTDWDQRVTDALLREDSRLCFAGNSERRYQGASQLAERLRALDRRHAELAAQARAQTQRERAAYRRGLLRAAALAIVVIGIVAAMAVVASKQAQRAARNFTSAQKVVDDMINVAGNPREADVVPARAEPSADEESVSVAVPRAGRSGMLPSDLANSAVSNYREFVAQSPNDPALKLNLARLCRNRAEIYSQQWQGGRGAGPDDRPRVDDGKPSDTSWAHCQGTA